MQQDYVTTNIRIPRAWHREFKRRAMEDEKSLGEFIRELLENQAHNVLSAHAAARKGSFLSDLAKHAKPLGGDLSSNIDKIVYDENYT